MNSFVSEKQAETVWPVKTVKVKLSRAMLETMEDAKNKRRGWYPSQTVFEASRLVEAFCHRFGIAYE